MSSIFDFSSLPSPRSMVNNIANPFNPSAARLAAANLEKGGVSAGIAGLSTTLSSSIGRSVNSAIGQYGSLLGGGIGNSIGGSVGSALNGAIGGTLNSFGSALNGANGLISGVSAGNLGSTNITFSGDASAANGSSTSGGTAEDWRIRVRCPAFGGAATVIFPVLPSVTLAFSAGYSSQRLTHSNYASYFYESSDVRAIQITGDFPIQTVDEGMELLNAINFFKATTKMFFGSGPDAGNPPPLVILDGFGKKYLNKVSCVVTEFQHTMTNDVDYINCNGTRLPTFSQIQVTLQPIVSRAKAGQFSLYKYANGWQEGFI